MSRSWSRAIVGVVLLVVGVGWLLHTSGLIDFPLRALTAVALIVVGVGLVLGSRHGSQTGLVVLGAVLTVALVAGSSNSWAVSVDRGFGFNDRVYRPTHRNDLRPYRAGAGQLTIDLTQLQLDLGGGTFDVHGRVGAGRILVIAPRGVPLRIEARSGVGSIEVFGEKRTSGISVRDTFESRDYAENRPRMFLHLRAGVGSVRVIQRRGQNLVPDLDRFLPRGPQQFPFDPGRQL